MRRAFAIAAGHLAFVAARTTLASPLPLDYSAPAGCLDRAAFLREVSERLPRNAAKVQTVRVAIQSVRDEFVARLEVVDAGGAMAEREISGLRCDQVSSAMALVVALVLTELAGQEQSLPAPRPEPETNPKPPVQTAAASRATTPAAAPGVPSERTATEPFPEADSARPAARIGRSIPFETGLMTTATGGIAPVVAWGAWGYARDRRIHASRGSSQPGCSDHRVGGKRPRNCAFRLVRRAARRLLASVVVRTPAGFGWMRELRGRGLARPW